jgi:5-methylcytosine-specific restriction endonuclease McrA
MTLDETIASTVARRTKGTGEIIAPKSPYGTWAVRWVSRGKRTYRGGYSSREEACAAANHLRDTGVPTKPSPRVHPRFHGPMGRCESCGWKPPFFPGGWSVLNSHHVVPRSIGGHDGAENRILLCPNCHAIAHHILYPRKNQPAWPRDRSDLLARLREMYAEEAA